MIVALGEPEEQAFHLDALAVCKKPLKASRAQIPKSLHEDVHLVEGFALWDFAEKFEYGAFRSGHHQWVLPFALLLCKAAVLRGLLRGVSFCEESRDVAVPEKPARVMQDELCVDGHARDPSRQDHV